MEDALTVPGPPVTIVGAGAAGSTLALLLARHGIATTVLERRRQPLTHPAAHVVNATSLEIWEKADPLLASTVAALSPPLSELGTIRWASDLHDPIADLNFLDDADEVAAVRTYSPYLRSHVGQHQLMRELWAALDRAPLVTFVRGVEVEDLTVLPDGTQRVGLTSELGHEDVDSAFVVAADGANSRLRDVARLRLEGPVLARMGSAFFRAPGLYPAGATRPLLTWIYRPDFAGVMIAHADDCYVLMTVYLHPGQEVAQSSRTYWERMVPTILGRDHDVEIRSTGTWEMTSQVATSFRRGRLLLVGDAAHRFPHTGGFGLNSGVQDADNLAWKLDAVLSGEASTSLLDTYEQERRPVVERFAEYSVANHLRLDEVTKVVGVTNRSLRQATRAVSSPPLSWLPARVMAPLAERATRLQLGRTAALRGTTAAGERARQHVVDTVPGQIEHFVATGLEFGYAYGGRLVDREPGEQPVVDEGVLRHRPTTWPGCRLPYLPLDDGRSVHTLVEDRGLTLLTFDPDAWESWVEAVGERLPVPVVVREVRPAGPRPDAVRLLEVGERGAVVVRPDGHVVWRSGQPPLQSGVRLALFLHRSWGPVWSGSAARATAAR